METIIKLALFALHFVLIAFVITTVIILGPWLLGRELTFAYFWQMFRTTCVILLILRAFASGDL